MILQAIYTRATSNISAQFNK